MVLDAFETGSTAPPRTVRLVAAHQVSTGTLSASLVQQQQRETVPGPR